MSINEIDMLRAYNIELLDDLLDYTICMHMATNYNPKGSPNLLHMTRLINRIGGEYIEFRQANRVKERSTL